MHEAEHTRIPEAADDCRSWVRNWSRIGLDLVKDGGTGRGAPVGRPVPPRDIRAPRAALHTSSVGAKGPRGQHHGSSGSWSVPFRCSPARAAVGAYFSDVAGHDNAARNTRLQEVQLTRV